MKTALQETFSELERLYPHLFDVHTEKGRDFINRFSIFLKLEEQQILNAHHDASMQHGFEYSADDLAQEYFNETYKTKTIVTEFRDGSVKVETFKSDRMKAEKQQSAVEFLIKELRKNRIVIPMEMEHQAKEMEKEQIMDAYWDGGQDIPLTQKGCEQYYNETFKSE